MILVKTGVMEIGRKSAGCTGSEIFGTGRIQACFHWCGTVDVESEKLNRCERGRQKIGAPSLRNQAGRPSKPVAVARKFTTVHAFLQAYNEWHMLPLSPHSALKNATWPFSI